MGYFASGDTRKMTQTSEDDEGYENQSSSTAISIAALNQSDVRDKQCLNLETTPGPVPSISGTDDTDRHFWAEDELSSAESRQQLNKKQKRRRSSSYRNRIAVQRSRSLLFQSSSSSLDSISGRISPGVSKQERLTSQFSIEQPGHSKTKKNNSRKKGNSILNTDRINCTEYKKFNQKGTRKQFLTNRKSRHQ